MYPPVLIIIRILHNQFGPYHYKLSFKQLLQTRLLRLTAHPNRGSPDGLHGQGDEAGDGVRQGEVEHQVVNIGPGSGT